MSEASDDAFDDMLKQQAITQTMFDVGCVPCPNQHKHDENECPICLDLGWINHSGEPCEP